MKKASVLDYDQLAGHITGLATLPETESPVLSAYLDLSSDSAAWRPPLSSWASLARHSFEGRAAAGFDEAVRTLEGLLRGPQEARGAAVFCRGGDSPFCLPLLFEVPVETQFYAGGLPAIFPLVELKDRFNRFVLVMVTSEVARIFEINLGEASEMLLAERPELRERLGREWTRQHYQNHRRERHQQFVKEKVAVIERLMAKHGHNALVLAGEPRFVNRLREALPRHLQDRIAGEIRSGFRTARLPTVIDEAIRTFLVQEAQQSHDAVRHLDEEVRRGGLAVVGLEASLRALARHQADLLILSSSLPEADREPLVRAAALADTEVETVQDSDLLARNGGVGCLLRYLESPDSTSERQCA